MRHEKFEESEASVPGGMLRYRVSGRESARPWLVFENGWGASFPHLYYMERALAPHARLLFYDRAGIGESRRSRPQTVPQLTAQLLALLAHLRIEAPVVLVGQSYGGLMSALHGAQAPDSVQAIIQIDPTPEIADPLIDRNLRMVLPLTRVMKFCARLGLPDIFFSRGAASLPPEVLRRVVKSSFRSIRSLDAATDEFRLLDGIRQAIDRANAASRHPRLVISAESTAPRKSRLQRMLVSDAESRAMLREMQALHRQQAASAHGLSRWEALPHDHGALVMSEDGAAEVARRVLRFFRELPAPQALHAAG